MTMPSTPTSASSASMSDLSFDAVSHGEAESSAEDARMTKHPVLFFRDDMVTISVEEMMFRIPHFFLSKSSTYFAQVLSEKRVPGEVFHISDADVSSSAFAHLLYVLYPPQLGMPKVQTITEWTNVLHLSTKWGFSAIRTTAIETILPLASPIDKIAIGRVYDIDAWIEDAFVEILARENDLTLAEAQRIPLEDVVAIAQGRRMARATASVKPRAELRNITAKITGRDPDQIQPVVDVNIPPSEDAQSKTAAEHVDLFSTIDKVAKRRIERWLATYVSMSKSEDRDAVILCISTFLKKQPAHMTLFLGLALSKGAEIFSESACPTGSIRNSNKSPDGRISELLTILSRDRNMQVVPLLTTVCLSLVNQWENIFLDPLCKSGFSETLIVTFLFGITVASARYFSYLAAYGLRLGDNIFKMFWVQMLKGSEEMMVSSVHNATHAIDRVLGEMGQYTFWADAGMEMDDFYDLLDRTREDCKDRALASSIQAIIDKRRWS